MTDKPIQTVHLLFPSDTIGFPDSYRALDIPTGSVRPDAKPGRTFLNTTSGALETYLNGRWFPLGGPVTAPERAPQPDLSEALVAGSNVELEPLKSGQVRVHVPMVGEVATGDNLGVGTGSVYAGKAKGNLQLRRLRSGNSNLRIETLADGIEFTVGDLGEANTGRALGKGVPVYTGKSGNDLLFRNLIGSTNISATAQDGDIQIGLNQNPMLGGSIGLGLPSGTGADEAQGQIGMIRYNSETDRFRIRSSQGWFDLSTDTGSFLPLIGGRLSGPLDTSSGINLTGTDLTVSGGRIISGPGGMRIDFAEGGSLITGTRGTIDGFRFPAIAAIYTELAGVPQGILIRTSEGFSARTLTGIENQIVLSETFQFGIAPNPVLPGTSSVLLPSGPDQSRDSRIGAIRYNSSGRFEGMHPSGWQEFATSENGTFSEIRISGDAFVSGLLNGRNIQSDLSLLDQIDSIRGLPYRASDGWTTTRITVNPDHPGLSISDSGAQIQLGLDPNFITALRGQILSGLNQQVVLANSSVAGRTIDGRNLTQDGVLIDDLNRLDPGLVSTSGSGQFNTVSVVGSADPYGIGISVDNSSGSGTMRIGLKLNSLPGVSALDLRDGLIVASGSGNVRVTVQALFALFKTWLAQS